MMFLKGVRDEYVKTFLVEEEGADRWADELQNLRMPITLSGEGTTLYKSRNLGGLLTTLPSMDEHEEQVGCQDKQHCTHHHSVPAQPVGDAVSLFLK
jgi:hypothetical protein